MRWNKSDIGKLSYYIRAYNSHINKLSELPEYKSVKLPQPLRYEEIKKHILTRKNFNQQLNYLQKSLKSFYSTPIKVGNVQILRGEYRLLERYRKNLIKYLNTEINKYNTPLEDNQYTWAEMGNTGYLFFENRLKNINLMYENPNNNFNKLRNKIYQQGNPDWLYYKQLVFYNNYKKALTKYSHFKNYYIWENILNKYKKNVDIFYSIMEKEIELIDLTYNSDRNFLESEFDKFLELILERMPNSNEFYRSNGIPTNWNS